MKIEEERVRAFAEAFGESDPIYTDVEAARAAGFPSLAIPLSFFFTLSKAGLPTTMAWMELLDVPADRILHGAVHFSYLEPVYAGMTVWVEATVVDIRESSRGDYDLLERETRICGSEGTLLVLQTETVVVRRTEH